MVIVVSHRDELLASGALLGPAPTIVAMAVERILGKVTLAEIADLWFLGTVVEF